MWTRYLEPRSALALRDFRTVDGERLLEDIAKEHALTCTTMAHIKAFLSGTFRYAKRQGVIFSYITLAQRIPADHPARQIRALVDRALERMDAEFEKLYSDTGRPSIAPERLLPRC